MYNFLQNDKNTISVADLDMRTTSVLEAMHSVIQRTFPSKPHIYKFIDNLKLHEAKKATDLYRHSQGDIKIQQIRAKDKKRAEKIKDCLEKLSKGCISVEKFLELISKREPIAAKKKLTSSVGWYSLFKYWIQINFYDDFYFYRPPKTREETEQSEREEQKH